VERLIGGSRQVCTPRNKLYFVFQDILSYQPSDTNSDSSSDCNYVVCGLPLWYKRKVMHSVW